MKIRRIFLRSFQAWVVVTVLIGAALEIIFVVAVVQSYLRGDSENRIFPAITINGKPAHLMLDTGASFTFLEESAARRLGIKFVPTQSSNITANWFGAKVPLSLSEPVSVVTGRKVLTGQLSVGDIPGLDIDGAIGWPSVRDFILIFDSERRTVSSVPELPAEAVEWLKLKVIPGDQLYLEVPLSDGRKGKIQVDTGQPRGVLLPPTQWKEWRAAHPWSVTADEIKLGPLTLNDVPVSEADWSGISDDFIGTLGMGALDRMDLIVDAKNGFAYLRPRPSSTSAPWTTKITLN